MKTRTIITATILAIVTVSPAYAMTNQQAKRLVINAIGCDQGALDNLIATAQLGDANAEMWLGSYYTMKGHYKDVSV